jgi:SOS-response transcriptional repressor LexA
MLRWRRCKIIDVENRQLISANPEFPPIHITGSMDVVVQGVVTFALNPMRVL